MVDVPREGYARKKRIRRILTGVVMVLVVLAVSWALSTLEPAAPSVDRSSVYLGQVERGPLVIEVRGPGTLVPEEIRWVVARVSGRVEQIRVLPGSQVESATVLVELDNPELEREVLNAELQLRQAEAELEDLRVALEREQLAQEAQAAGVQAEYVQRQLQADLNQQLAREGLISDLTLKLSEVTADELSRRNSIEQKRLAINSQSAEARIAAKEAQVAQLRGLFELRRRQLDSLAVRAGIAGVLQQTPVEIGQQVAPGEVLGKVAVPERLKAQLRIPETQAKDVEIGLSASIDTRNGLVPGRVVRIDPAAQEGTVRVDIALTGPLPLGARPDLNVDGTIQIDRLEDVLKLGRPAYGQANSTVGLFRLSGEGGEASRVRVRLGRSSVTTIEVVEGLAEGDRVVLSDTSAWDSFDRIRLN